MKNFIELEVFIKNKEEISKATLLAHPSTSSKLCIMVDVTDPSIGVAIHQYKWDVFKFYLKKIFLMHKTSIALDRELLAIYESIRFKVHHFYRS